MQVDMTKIEATLNIAYDNPTPDDQWTQINPSCVLAYLGIKGYGNITVNGNKKVEKNAVPLLMYYDTFKNYYANTQEENFYIVGATQAIEGIIVTQLS